VNVVEVERELGHRSLYDFVKLGWSQVETGKYSDNWHIPLICGELESVTRGDVLELLINIPPGCMKSLLVQVFWQAWSWIQDPTLRFIGASFDHDLTKRDSARTLRLIHSQWFQERWGHRVWVAPDASVVIHENSAGGWRQATSIEGKLTGKHGDAVTIDDPSKPLDVMRNPKRTLSLVRDWRYGTLPTRFRDISKARKVLIMQRLHEDDLAGLALKEGTWRTVILPMRYDPARAHPKDPRTQKGELLWPDRFPEEAVRKLEDPKTGLGARQTAAQLQQKPTPDDGNIFKRTWFKYYVARPARFDIIIISVDCAFKDAEDSSYVVLQVWGMKGGEFFLLEQVRKRMSFTETCAEFAALARKWRASRAKLVEDKANGTAVIDTFKKKIPGVIPVTPTESKPARARAVSPLCEAGNVYLPATSLEPLQLPQWVEEYIEELVGFPFAAANDQVDATTQALNWLSMHAFSYEAAAKNAPFLFGN